jgi:hypothetical protein
MTLDCAIQPCLASALDLAEAIDLATGREGGDARPGKRIVPEEVTVPAGWTSEGVHCASRDPAH